MIRGKLHYGLAVRRASGDIHSLSEPLNHFFTGRLRRMPLVRGVILLLETLVLGIKVLNRSANMAVADQGDGTEEMPRWVLALTLAFSLALGIGVFFILPIFAVRPLEELISSNILSNVIEGIIRLVLLIGYILAISMMRDIRRVFAYHGAEHMAVHAHEAGLPLDVANVRKFSTAHPRCGTAFLLTVAVVSIVVFAGLGRPPLEWLISSRVLLIPVIASISYEFIRFSGAHHTKSWTRPMTFLGLLLQRLTTRQPDDSQIEVAIQALETTLMADRSQL